MLGAGGTIERAARRARRAERRAGRDARGVRRRQRREDATLSAEKSGAHRRALGGARRAASPGTASSARSRTSCPSDVWLDEPPQAPSRSCRADPAASREPAGVHHHGATYSQSGVARLLSRLAVVPTLANVQLESSLLDESRPSEARQVHDHRRRPDRGARREAQASARAALPRRRRRARRCRARGWFVLVAPKRAEATELEIEIAATRGRRCQPPAALATAPPTRSRSGRRHLPAHEGDAGRRRTCRESCSSSPGSPSETGIKFESITPESSTVAGTYQVSRSRSSFDGNFYELSDFLFRLRTLVAVRTGELDATGRLFTVADARLRRVAQRTFPSSRPPSRSTRTSTAPASSGRCRAGPRRAEPAHDPGEPRPRPTAAAARRRRPDGAEEDQSCARPRQAKQKKIAIGGWSAPPRRRSPFQGPKTLKMLKGRAPGGRPTAPAPAAHRPSRPSRRTAPVARLRRAPVADADSPWSPTPTPVAGDGQLVSFEQFESKDPFAPAGRPAGRSGPARQRCGGAQPTPTGPAAPRRPRSRGSAVAGCAVAPGTRPRPRPRRPAAARRSDDDHGQRRRASGRRRARRSRRTTRSSSSSRSRRTASGQDRHRRRHLAAARRPSRSSGKR